MWLKRISILNYKNLEQVEQTFSPKLNCIVGRNGMGKTNLLDAVYYLSFCKSATNPADSQNILHGQDFFVIQGWYDGAAGDTDEVYCGLKRRQKKVFRRNRKDYTRLSDHIGLIPLVMVSPADAWLIAGGSEERRRFMDVVIAQSDRTYLDALIRYNQALQQRNALLKGEALPDDEVMGVWEEMMAAAGETVYRCRKAFIDGFVPVFRSFYACISQDSEEVSLEYVSHAQGGDLAGQLREARHRDRLLGYSTRGVHKDDLVMQLGGFPVKKEGSQGQNKTFLIALKLAQFDFLKRSGRGETPIVLLDDIFDKLDAGRVEQIVKLVSDDNFGQIFITDTNREHLDRMLEKLEGDYCLLEVERGAVYERGRRTVAGSSVSEMALASAQQGEAAGVSENLPEEEDGKEEC